MKRNLTIFVFACATLLATHVVYSQFGGLGDLIKGASEGGKDKEERGRRDHSDSEGNPLDIGGNLSLKQELDMGGTLAVEIAAKKGGVLKDKAMTERVATIGKTLSLYCNRPHLPYMFIVLDNSEINAYSCPGGYVFVTKGLVDSCKSDKQLAAVLAHEIAHITERHALKVAAGKKDAGSGAMIGSILVSAAGVNDFGLVELAGAPLARTIIDKGYAPTHEYRADLVGTILMSDTGFPPRTLRDYLDGLKVRSFSTHPSAEKRVERLDDEMRDRGMK